MSSAVGRRRHKRIAAALPVRLWGMDADGRPFIEVSKTDNVSRTGALLTGLPTKLAVGDVIGVTYKDKKCKFRVVWTGKRGAPDAGSVGLQNVDPGNWIWDGLSVPADDTDTYIRSPQQERRQAPRVKCLISAEIVSEPEKKTLAFATSISVGGCYIHMPHPFPLETRVSLALWLDEQHKVWVDGIVVSSETQAGMIVKFLGLSQTQRGRIWQFCSSSVT